MTDILFALKEVYLRLISKGPRIFEKKNSVYIILHHSLHIKMLNRTVKLLKM